MASLFSNEIPLHNISGGRGHEKPPEVTPFPFPKEQNFATSEETVSSPMWNYMQARIKKDLPFAKVCGLRRFGIRNLWEQFKLQKALAAARNNDQNPNTQLLFHASPHPSRITGTGYGENGNGFDPRCGNGGTYGTGAYFAEHAFYPVEIHPKIQNSDGTYHILVAEVIVGQEKDYGNNLARDLTRPPNMSTTGCLYDSVSGTENGIAVRRGMTDEIGRQIVVFGVDRSYPHYLLTIKIELPFQLDVRSMLIFRNGIFDATIRKRDKYYFIEDSNGNHLQVSDNNGSTGFINTNYGEWERWTLKTRGVKLFFLSGRQNDCHGNTLGFNRNGEHRAVNKNLLGHEEFTVLPLNTKVDLIFRHGAMKNVTIKTRKNSKNIEYYFIEDSNGNHLQVSDNNGSTGFINTNYGEWERWTLKTRGVKLFFLSGRQNDCHGNTLGFNPNGEHRAVNKNLLRHEEFTVRLAE